MSKKKKARLNNMEKKTEWAKAISKNSQPFQRTYARIEVLVGKIWHFISEFIDRYLFNPRYGKFIALVFALILYISMNFDSNGFLENIQNVETLGSFPVNVLVADEAYEVSGLPNEVVVRYMGDIANIKSAKQQKGFSVVADLTDLTEGVHEVALLPQAAPSGVEVVIEPSNAIVTIKKKSIRRFTLGYDIVNQSKMDSTYDIGVPVFKESEVYVRASKETLDSIASVKALIDVSQAYKEDFTCKAKIVAYDNNGDRLNVDIIPETMDATVVVSKPQKEVDVVLQANGDIPNGMAIASYTVNHPKVTIYGKEDVLKNIDTIPVVIPASTLTSNRTITMPLIAPNGVRQISENFVDITIKLDKKEVREIKNVDVEMINLKEGFKATFEDKNEVSVVLEGAEKVIKGVKADDIKVYVDLSKNDQVGTYELPVLVEGNNPLVNYSLGNKTISVVISKVGD